MALTVRHNVAGAELTTMAVGGPCSTLIDIASEAELVEALSNYPDAIVVGGGSNLLISDEGFDGTLIRSFSPGRSGIVIDRSSDVVVADAPVEWDVLVQATIEADLQGLESTSGVPGSFGGAVVQNLGAYGQETADVVVDVTVWDRTAKRSVVLTREECQFRYRSSRFKHDQTRRFVVTSARLRLQHSPTAMPRYGDVTELLAERHSHPGPYRLHDIREVVLEVRRRKGMVTGASHPSAGSFFTNPLLSTEQANQLRAQGFRVTERADGAVLASAAELIEAAGFTRGYRRGATGLSDQHVLALVNLDGATTTEVIDLAHEVRQAVHEHFGVWLFPEPVMLGFAAPPFTS